MEGLLEARGLHGYAESHVLLSFLHFVFQLFEGEDESESISSHSCSLFPLYHDTTVTVPRGGILSDPPLCSFGDCIPRS